MDISDKLEKFIDYMKKVIIDTNKKFHFIDNVNVNQLKEDKLYGQCTDVKLYGKKDYANRSRIISVRDFIFFCIKQAFTNGTYDVINTEITNANLTNVTSDAYKKKRKRKSYKMFQFIYYSILQYYEKNFKEFPEFEDELMAELNLAAVDGSKITTYKHITDKSNRNNQNIMNDKFTENIELTKYTEDDIPDILKPAIIDQKLGKKQIKKETITYEENNVDKCYKKKSILSLSTIFSCNNLIPLNVKINLSLSETASFYKQIDEQKEKLTFLFDRGYYSYELLEKIILRKHDAVFRMKCEKINFVDRFIESKLNDKIIYIHKKEQSTSKNSDAIKIRLIYYEINDEKYVILTTLIDIKKYSYEFLVSLYKQRWAVEMFYKILNSDMNLKETRNKLGNTFLQDLYNKMTIHLMSKIFQKFAVLGCPTVLKDNEHINMTSCRTTTVDSIIKMILYNDDKNSLFIDLIQKIREIRTKTVIYEKDRKFDMVALRPHQKWYMKIYQTERNQKKKIMNINKNIKITKKIKKHGGKSKKITRKITKCAKKHENDQETTVKKMARKKNQNVKKQDNNDEMTEKKLTQKIIKYAKKQENCQETNNIKLVKKCNSNKNIKKNEKYKSIE